MTLKVTLAEEGDAELWDDIVNNSQHGTIFHRWKWLKITEMHSKAKLYPIIFYRGKKIIALYPMFVYKGKIFKIAYSPPPEMNLIYMGPVMKDYETLDQYKKERLFTEIQKCLDSYLFETLSCGIVRIHLSPGLYDSRPLVWCGYKINSGYTYKLDISGGLESIWNNFHPKLRATINRSLRKGVFVKEGDESNLHQIIAELTRRRREEKAVVNEDNSFYHHIIKEFKNNIKIFLCYYQDKLVGNVVVLLDRDTVRCWMGTPKFYEKGIYGNDVVCWEAIKWAHNHSYRYFENMDFGYKQELALFKSRFNSVPVIWFEGRKYSSRLWRLGESIFGRQSS
jgi:hypothetical protein